MALDVSDQTCDAPCLLQNHLGEARPSATVTVVSVGQIPVGKRSGLELGQMGSKGANLFHVRDRKVTRLVHYWDGERALADLGLAQQG